MKTFPLAALLGVSLVAGAANFAFAQTAEPPALVPMAPAANEARAVKIVNVPSAFIAYWLDPANNERPAPLSVPFADKPLLDSVSKELSKGLFLLPDGIERIVSVDAQNVVLITGTARAIRQVEDLIAVLDQPLRQVEIEAQFVESTTADLKNFGVDYSTSRGNFDAATLEPASAPVQGAFRVGFARNNFSARLNALIADDKAKIITAPRVTAINNLPATLNSPSLQGIKNGGEPQMTRQGYTVTPTINSDDSITVLLKDVEEPKLTTIANMRDGDTIVLSEEMGLRPADPERVIVVFLTARIIRQAGEIQKK